MKQFTAVLRPPDLEATIHIAIWEDDPVTAWLAAERLASNLDMCLVNVSSVEEQMAALTAYYETRNA